MTQQQSWITACQACGDWGSKDHGTVKVDAAALQAQADKENAAPPNSKMMSKEEQASQEKARQRQEEEEAKQAELRRQEEQRKEMERRVKEEQERQQSELRRREADRQRLQTEQEARDREEQQRQIEEQRLKDIEDRKKLDEVEKKLQQDEEQKKIRAWLQANGFKGVNDVVRKKFSKVAPLQCAIQQKDLEILKLLLQNGADASKVNGKNQSALTVAKNMDKKGSHAAVVEALTTYPTSC
jgi:hypothetical protein